jgi:ATP adenylyltransferase
MNPPVVCSLLFGRIPIRNLPCQGGDGDHVGLVPGATHGFGPREAISSHPLHRILTFRLPLPSLLRMEWLHAPWRIEYILAPKGESGDGLFTRIAQSQDDEENLVLARERSCFAVLNRYPYSGGHLMVVPYKEAKDLNDLTDEELTDVMRLLRRCQNAMTTVLRPDGFNVGINLGRVAGAGILGHLHVHIVPRWNGDTNFMPVIAGTHVLPEALKEIAEKIRGALAAQQGRERQE